MSRHSSAPAFIFVLVAMAGLLSTTNGRAQSAGSLANTDWELNFHAAALRPGLFEESTGAFQFGARLVRNFGSGISLGGSVDWARSSDVSLPPVENVGSSLFLYSAELDYRFRVSPRAEFFLGAGAGAATLTLNQAPIGVAERSTGLLVPVGGGIKFLNRADSPSWAIRFDVRDNIILLESLNPGGGIETEPRNNVEASIGLSILFGGGEGREATVVRDTDRDGVPDPRDFCLNRPGAEVDARGCPREPEQAPAIEPEGLEEPAEEIDSDGDGVPDSVDGCLGTRAGTEVQADGCPVLPRDPQELLGDSDADGVADEVDVCPATAAGIAVDETGCLVQPAPGEENQPAADLAPEPDPEPEAAVEPDETPAAEVTTACLDSSVERTLEYDGRSFQPAGFPQTVDRAFLVQVGSVEGLPIYVSDTTRKPFADFWVPRCGAENLFELYVEVGALP